MHDAYSGPGANRGPGNAGVAVAGTGVGFTGVSPKIEVVGLHYEVTPADLKVCTPISDVDIGLTRCRLSSHKPGHLSKAQLYV